MAASACLLPLVLCGRVFAAGGVADVPLSVPLDERLELARHQRLVMRKVEPGTTLAAFVSDGCSGGLSVGWHYLAGRFPDFRARHGGRPPWEACCIAHDRRYHAGGGAGLDARTSFAARLAADRELRSCVERVGPVRAPELRTEYGLAREEVGILYATIADLMYHAVRLGGVPCTGLPWRWGYGWPACR